VSEMAPEIGILNTRGTSPVGSFSVFSKSRKLRKLRIARIGKLALEGDHQQRVRRDRQEGPRRGGHGTWLRRRGVQAGQGLVGFFPPWPDRTTTVGRTAVGLTDGSRTGFSLHERRGPPICTRKSWGRVSTRRTLGQLNLRRDDPPCRHCHDADFPGDVSRKIGEKPTERQAGKESAARVR
jgi:hypothetical protein